MNIRLDFGHFVVDRRIGGLEKVEVFYDGSATVDRRIGGLEICFHAVDVAVRVDRRIGGLEITLPDSSQPLPS